MRKIPVNRYPIFVDQGLSSLRGELARLGGPFYLLTNAKVHRLWRKALRPVIGEVPILKILDGEEHKNLKTVEGVYHQLLKQRVDRHGVLLLLGGGVVGDLGGYVASTFLRGIRFVQIPTTLVGQVDSSIGGKVGVDLPEGKNLVGSFYHPAFVYANIQFLTTLARRDLLGGLAEVLKYGVIQHADFFRWVVKKKENIFERNLDTLQRVVQVSAATKAAIVSQDEKESGLRMVLNFGHTFGHALEKLTRYRGYTHGEAVAIGMVIAARLSRKLGYCQPETEQEIIEGITRVGLPTRVPPFKSAHWLQAIGVDKKRHQGKIRFVFVKKLGQVVIESTAPERLVKLL